MEDKPLKVMMIEDNPGDARLMREYLRDITSLEFDLTEVGRLDDALERAKESEFDVMLLDLSLPDSRGLETFQRIRQVAPRVPVVIITGLDDEDLAVKTMEEGAQDYLVKGQIDGDSLLRSIRYSMAREGTKVRIDETGGRRGRGKVLGFRGAKGGTGTTTIALNVAAALAAREKEVIAAEIRSDFGTFSAQLGRAATENISHLNKMEPELINEKELNARLVSVGFGPRILFGPQRVEEFEALEPDRMSAVVEGLAGMCDFLIADIPCHTCSAGVEVMRRCDYVAVVTEREPGSIVSAGVAANQLQYLGIARERTGAILVNRSPTTSGASLRDISSEIGCDIIGAIPQAADGFLDAQRRGVPLVVTDPTNAASVSLVEIVDRLSADAVPPLIR